LDPEASESPTSKAYGAVVARTTELALSADPVILGVVEQVPVLGVNDATPSDISAAPLMVVVTVTVAETAEQTPRIQKEVGRLPTEVAIAVYDPFDPSETVGVAATLEFGLTKANTRSPAETTTVHVTVLDPMMKHPLELCSAYWPHTGHASRVSSRSLRIQLTP
jgi:hypothetical protein